MLAKVIAYAPTRSEAAARLATALARARIHGVTTNRDLLVGILREDEFLAGGTDTAYLDRHDPAALGAPLLDEAGARVHALAAVLAVQAANRSSAPVWGRLPSGWRNNPSQLQQVRLSAGDGELAVAYSLDRAGVLTASVDDVAVDAVLHGATAEEVELTVDGVRRRCQVTIAGDVVDVDSPLGASSYTLVPRFPDHSHDHAAGSLVAPMPGSVVRVLVDVGAEVDSGQPLVVLEAMKMEHTVAAPGDGTVGEVRVAAGQQVEAGAVLVVFEESSDAD
jgi:acetyl/propionyl-CoA carboxylase alpha subunit